MKPIILLMALTSAIVITHCAAGAVTLASLDMAELVQLSHEIVHGTVTEVTSHWNADHSLIVTAVRVRIHETLMGDAEDEVVLVHPGGIVGALRVEVPGAGSFRTGQETVLFLFSDDRGQRHVTGLTQGRFDVESGRASEVKVVRATSNLEHSGGTRTGDSTKIQGAERLSVFLARVKKTVNERAKEEER